MATVERIEQDLATLEEAIALLGAELHSAYANHLTLLRKAVRQQLILACYQVCTQGYPESFLSLSFNQRQQLQQLTKQLAEQAQAQLLSSLDPPQFVTRAAEPDESEPTPPASPTPQEQSEPEAVVLEPQSSFAMTLTPPEQLRQWQEQLEEAIAQTLQTLSLEINRLLQKSGIIPDKLPAAVLEAAAKADASAEAMSSSPNLLNLLMETDDEDEKEDSTLTRITAVNLRLAEIEFADSQLLAGRNQIRKLSERVGTLQRQYHKKRRERAVAQAEAEWRSSWFDE